MRVKLNSNGYTKIYSNGKNTSVAGNYTNDVEVQEFLTSGGQIEPEFTQGELDEQIRLNSLVVIDARLNEIDKKSIRSIRKKSTGRDAQADRDRLIELDDEANTLRDERDILDPQG